MQDSLITAVLEEPVPDYFPELLPQLHTERRRGLTWINYQDSRPIYEQITERYKVLILKGVLAPDEQMPSVRRLAMELSTNPNTVQRAYMELERQGFLYSVRGRGSFVRGGTDLHAQKRAELAGRLSAILKEAEDIGIDPARLLAECGWKENTEND